MKWLRAYSMTVEVDKGESIVIESILGRSLTLELDISRKTMASTNRAHFTIYNLGPDTRRRIFHDQFDIKTYRGIELKAGYETDPVLPLVFRGNILTAYSYRRGVDWVTEIEALDGGFGVTNSQISVTLPAGWSMKQVLQTLASSMKTLSVGAIGNFSTLSSRGISLQGNSWDLLNSLVDNQQAFIDNEQVHVLKVNEYIQKAGGINLVSSDTGLLNTPRRFNGQIDVEIMFEPRAQVGQVVQVESLETVNNGVFKIIGVCHRGTISGAVCGNLTTVLNLFNPNTILVPVQAQAQRAAA